MSAKDLFSEISKNTAWITVGVTTIYFVSYTLARVPKIVRITLAYVAAGGVALAAAWIADNLLYFLVFVLGIATAFAEVISKFPDEPAKALATSPALLYHLLNGLIAILALYVLIVFKVPYAEPADKLKIVLAAGLGSMLVMRSKLFNLKVAGEDLSFGPEQIVKIFFRFMEAAIDRLRAQSRMAFIKDTLDNVDFHEVDGYCLTMLSSAQALDDKTRTKCKDDIKKLKTDPPQDTQLKSYELGFLLLNTMGEEFVAKLFEKKPREWMIQAPTASPDAKEAFLWGLIHNLLPPRDDSVSYFAYGSSMSSPELRKRLRWADKEETQFRADTKPRRAVLEHYRLEFNKPEGTHSSQGRANIVPDSNGTVEGVVYQLKKSAVEFLDKYEVGYVRQSLAVKVDGKDVKAELYVAESTRPGLKPDDKYLDVLLDGAREHQLGDTYIRRLEIIKSTGN